MAATQCCHLPGNFPLYKAKCRRRANCADKTISPTKAMLTPKVMSVQGGQPITKENAIKLMDIVFGVSSGLLRSPWYKSGLTFREVQSNLSFGLLAQKNEIKGFVMCIQAYVLKNLLFQCGTGERIECGRYLKPEKCEQEEILALALADVLWKVSEDGDRPTVVCLPQQNIYLVSDDDFTADGLTERIHTFEFSRLDDVQIFLRSYLHVLQELSEPGCLLVVYSIVLTKGFSKLRLELDGAVEHLLTPRGESSQALVNLLLTGRATPYTHNGAIYEEEDEFSRGKTKIGILERSEMGFLMWQRCDPDGSLVGSRLKTPCLPIWVTKTGNQYGVLFNTNRELTRDYHAERHFDLYYYSSNRSQSDVIYLSIDTKTIRNKEERDIPLLEHLILTK